MEKEIENLEFVEGLNIEFIDSLKSNGTKYLFIFENSSEEICNSKAFFVNTIAGRHRALGTFYNNHDLWHQANLGETLSSRTRILVSSILAVKWCKSTRLVQNWDSDQK